MLFQMGNLQWVRIYQMFENDHKFWLQNRFLGKAGPYRSNFIVMYFECTHQIFCSISIVHAENSAVIINAIFEGLASIRMGLAVTSWYIYGKGYAIQFLAITRNIKSRIFQEFSFDFWKPIMHSTLISLKIGKSMIIWKSSERFCGL